jgi:hypothetical protein
VQAISRRRLGNSAVSKDMDMYISDMECDLL